MGNDKIFIVFYKQAFSEVIEMVLPSREMAEHYIRTKGELNANKYRFEEHEVKYEY